MLMLRSFLFIAALFLVACASSDEDELVIAPLPEIEATRSVKTLWSFDVEGVGDLYNSISPVIAYDKVFVPSADGEVVALDENTGKVVWRSKLGAKISGALAAGNGVVVVGTLDAEVIVLDQESGQEKWRTLVSSEVISPAAVGDNRVVVNTVDGKLFCIDVATGKRQWFYDRSVPVLTLRGTSSAQIAHGAAIAGFANGKIAAFLLKNGGLVWEKRVASPSGRSELDRMIDIDANPIIFGENVYTASYNGNIMALNLRDGEVVWQRELSTFRHFGVDARAIFAADYASHIKALKRSNGSTLWTQSKLENRQLTGPVVFKDMVIVGDLEGYLHFLNRDNGEFVARSEHDGSFLVEPLVKDDKVYAFTRAGTLSALTVQ